MKKQIMGAKEEQHENGLDWGQGARTVLAASGQRRGLHPAPGTEPRAEAPGEGPPPQRLSPSPLSVADSLCIYRQVIQVLCILTALSVKEIKQFLLHRFGVGIK